MNILGATPIDFGKTTTLEDLEQLLVDNDIPINVSLWKNTTKQDIARLKQGVCNIVVSHAGAELAEYMEKRYGIPYVTGLPFGEKYSKLWISRLQEIIQNGVVNEYSRKSLNDNKKHILILGEQFQSMSIRNAIEAEYGISCDVAGICGWRSEFARENDRFLESEEEIENILNEEKYDWVIGDGLYKNLLHSNKKFYEYSHYAVSSKLGNEKARSLIGKNVEIL